MKLKTIVILIIIVVLTFLIYLTTLDKKIYYLNLGDEIAANFNDSYGNYVVDYLKSKQKFEKYVSEFITHDYRTTDLIRDINDNRNVYSNNKNQSLKNALIKADIITLSIGSNDIYYKITTSTPKECYSYMDQVLVDLEFLLEQLRKYCKEEIIMLNYYNAYKSEYDEIFEYMNDKLDDLAKIYNIQILDVSTILNHKTLDERLPTDLENQVIAQKIKEFINKDVFN